MSLSKPTRRDSAVRSMASLALLAPLVVGAAIGLSSAGDGVALENGVATEAQMGGLRSTRTRTIDLASLPSTAFGDAD